MSKKNYRTTSASWSPSYGTNPPDKNGKWRLVNAGVAKNAPDTQVIKQSVVDDRYPSYINARKDVWMTVPNWDKSVTIMWFWEKMP